MNSVVKDALKKSVSMVDNITRPIIRIVPSSKMHKVPEIENVRSFIDKFRVDCIFDVGANCGQYAQMLRNDIGFKGTIISFEPIPECAEQLRALAARDEKWFIEEVALSDETGTVKFNIMNDSQFSSILKPENSKAPFVEKYNSITKEVEVKTETIENYVKKYDIKSKFKRLYLKMDTQGNDLLVATGAGESLSIFTGIQSELSIVPLYEGSPNYIEAIKFYNNKGFNLTALVPNNQGHFPRLLEIDCIMYNPVFAVDL